MFNKGQRVMVKPDLSADQLRSHNDDYVYFAKLMHKTLGKVGTIIELSYMNDCYYLVDFDDKSLNNSDTSFWMYRKDWLINIEANEVNITEED